MFKSQDCTSNRPASWLVRARKRHITRSQTPGGGLRDPADDVAAAAGELRQATDATAWGGMVLVRRVADIGKCFQNVVCTVHQTVETTL